MALDKVDEAIDAAQNGLHVEAQNSSLKTILHSATKRKAHLVEIERARKERKEQLRLQQATIRMALKQRKIPTSTSERPPEVPEAAIALGDALNPSSALSFPVMLLYPAHAQTDFIKAFHETESIGEHLAYILPLPWDEQHEYTRENVECYMGTIEGGLIKAGKKLSLLKLLSSGKLEVADGLVRINVVPKDRAAQWISEFQLRRGKQ